MNLPTLTAYLERLQFGLDSHPDCLVKASVYRDSIAALPLRDAESMPPPLRDLLENPPPLTAWIPEVHSNAILLAVRDQHFTTGATGLDAFEEWVRERNRRFLTRPLYRALFLVLSPERLMSGLERRWGAFRKGTKLSLIAQRDREAELSLRFPADLYDATSLRGMRAAFRAAAEAAGARSVEIDIREVSVREARYLVRWR